MLTIKLFNKIELPSANGDTQIETVSAFNLECAYFGYTLSGDVISRLEKLDSTTFNMVRSMLLSDLSSIKGGDKTYIRLFNDFPYSVPDQHNYMEQRIIGNMANQYNIPLGGNTITPLSCGHVIDSALFNIDEFGACPICQRSVPELSSPDNAVHDFKSVTPLTILDLTKDGFVAEANGLLNRNSSLSQDEKTFLTTFEHKDRLSYPANVYRENVPFLYSIFGADKIKDSLVSVTDVMRIAYYLSDPASDLSLKENVRFKLSSAQRKSMMLLMEHCNNLAEDMLRNRERWLRLGEQLHPATDKNKRRFPKVAEAFDMLRNRPKEIVTFSRKSEKALRSNTIDQDVIDLFQKRPGEFARKLDALIRKSGNDEKVVDGFEKVLPDITERMILDLRKYFLSRNDLDQRLFIPKGQVNKVQVVNDNRENIPENIVQSLVDSMDAELLSRYASKEPLGKVYVDRSLNDILLPYNRRGDSSSTGSMSKGNRYTVNGDYLRMFVWWKNGTAGRVDVDLSTVFFDDDFNQVGHVAFTNLSNGSMIVHSGDIQDAPKGASEFIDIDIKQARKSKARYFAISVNSYTGQTFDQYECFAGFMERDGMRSGSVYEPESVRFRLDLNQNNTSAIPLLYDVLENKIVVADIAGGKSRYGAVINQNDKFKALTKAMIALPQRKATIYDYALLNAKARGSELVDSPEDADFVYDMSSVSDILSEIG